MNYYGLLIVPQALPPCCAPPLCHAPPLCIDSSVLWHWGGAGTETGN